MEILFSGTSSFLENVRLLINPFIGKALAPTITVL